MKFVWIGDGELRDQLTSENIEITGWADRSTAIRYAVNADVFFYQADGKDFQFLYLNPCI